MRKTLIFGLTFLSILSCRSQATQEDQEQAASKKIYLQEYGSNMELDNKAAAKAEAQDLQGAIEDYTKALEINPKDIWAIRGLTRTQKDAGDYRGAIASYEKYIEACSREEEGVKSGYVMRRSVPEQYYQIGSLKAMLGDYEGAVAAFSKAIEMHPKDAVACNERGAARRALHDYAGSVSDFSRAIELNAEDARAYYYRGLSKSDLLNHMDAIRDFKKAISLNPGYAFAYREMGRAEIALGLNASGKADLNKAVELGDPYAADVIKELCK